MGSQNNRVESRVHKSRNGICIDGAIRYSQTGCVARQPRWRNSVIWAMHFATGVKARLGPIFMHFRPIPTMIRAKPSVMMVFSQVVSANIPKLIFNTLARIIYWLLMEYEQSEQNCYIQYQTSSHVEAAWLVTQPNCKLCFGRKSSNHLNSKLVFTGKKSPVQGCWWALGLKHQTVGANLLKQTRLISWVLHVAMLVKVQNSWGSPPTEPERLRNWIHEGPLMITSSRFPMLSTECSSTCLDCMIYVF